MPWRGVGCLRQTVASAKYTTNVRVWLFLLWIVGWIEVVRDNAGKLIQMNELVSF